ncbi:hypothetical protein HDU97_006714 [Phlyctochytrium planicorne]|nr:hypothetical protein HDU97_006714 [Phlyctochytrium planicorne]
MANLEKAPEDCLLLSSAISKPPYEIIRDGCCQLRYYDLSVECSGNHIRNLTYRHESIVDFDLLYQLPLKSLIVTSATPKSNTIVPASSNAINTLEYITYSLLRTNDFPLPASVGNYGKLTSLAMTDMGLTGQIPSSFANFKYLRGLNLYRNKLSGIVPSFVDDFLTPENNFYISLGKNCFDSRSPLPKMIAAYGMNFLERSETCPLESNTPDPNSNPNPNNPNPNNPNNPNPNPNPNPNSAQNPSNPTSNSNPGSTSLPPGATDTGTNIVETFASTRVMNISGTIVTTVETGVRTQHSGGTGTPESSNQNSGASAGAGGNGVNLGVIVGSAFGALVLGIIVIAALLWGRRRKDAKDGNIQKGAVLPRWSLKKKSGASDPKTPTDTPNPTQNASSTPSTMLNNNHNVLTFSSPLNILNDISPSVDDNYENTTIRKRLKGEEEDSDSERGEESARREDMGDDTAQAASRDRPAVEEGHPILSWTPEDVKNWLDSIGIKEAVSLIFIHREITGRTLATLTDSDLENDLGIYSSNTRTTILLSIEEIIEDPNGEGANGDVEVAAMNDEMPPGIEELPPPYAVNGHADAEDGIN